MTFKEKYIIDNPFDEYDINGVICNLCPRINDIPDKPEYCLNKFDEKTCEKCWDREIPEEDNEHILSGIPYVPDSVPNITINIRKLKYKIFFGTHDFNGAVSADDLLNQWIDEHPGVYFSVIGYQHTRYGDHSILICYEEE